MKKIFLVCLLLSSACFAKSKSDYQILSVEDFTKLEELKVLKDKKTSEVEEYMNTKWDPNIVVQFKKGMKFPVKFSMSGDFFNISNNEKDLEIMITKDLYIRLDKGDFLFSSDLEKWETTSNFFSGNIEASFAEEEGKMYFKVGGEVNKRKASEVYFKIGEEFNKGK